LTEIIPYNERDLLERIQLGDAGAFEILYNQYRHKLYGFILRLTKSPEMTADIVQDVFLKIWEDRTKFSHVHSFSHYFQSMVYNRSINLLKRIAFEDEIVSQLSKEAGNSEEGDPVLYNELRRKLRQLVDQLPEQQRAVYRLSKEEGLKQEEIARQLNISLNTVKTHLSRSMAFIRSGLGSSLVITCWQLALLQ
jgi:RNA polymerase sigma-70 factor (family 1)